MRQHSRAPFSDSLVVRRLSVDDLSNVRYLHSLSFRSLLASELDEEDQAGFLAQIASPDYGERLLGERHLLAFCHHELVGTAGWAFSPVGTPEARLVSIFVHPLFTRLGIARHLVGAVEDDARSLGFDALTAPVPEHAARFLRRLGFSAPTHDAALTGSVARRSIGIRAAIAARARRAPVLGLVP